MPPPLAKKEEASSFPKDRAGRKKGSGSLFIDPKGVVKPDPTTDLDHQLYLAFCISRFLGFGYYYSRASGSNFHIRFQVSTKTAF